MQLSETPYIGDSDQRMLFSERQYVPTAGKLLVLLSLATVALAFWLPDPEPVAYYGIIAVAGVLLILGGIISSWTQTVLLDFENSVCISRRGPRFLAKSNATPLSDVDHVLLCSEPPDESGMPDNARYTLSIALPERQIFLFTRRVLENAINVANTIADRVDRPLRVTEAYNEAPAAPKNPRWVSGVTWMAMLTVAGIMLWPVISGSRPLFAQFGIGRKGIFSENDGVETPYQKGVRQYELGQFADAEKTFRDALKENPKEAEIGNMLAYSLAEQGKLDDALKTANEALKLVPSSGNIIDTVAEMHERRAEFKDAADLYAKALKNMDIESSGETNTKFGRTLIALNRKGEAKKRLMDAIKHPSYRWDPLARRLLLQLDPNIKLPRPIPSPTLNLRAPGGMPMMLRP